MTGGAKEPILGQSGALILAGLAAMIVSMMSSPFLGAGALVFGIAVFVCSVVAAGYLPSEAQPDMECLSCGKRLVSPRQCNACGASQVTRVTERQLVSVACALLFIGMFFLAAASVYSETRISTVDSLRESDNFRQIRVVGKVVDLVDYYPEKYDDTGTIRLLVDDGTGEINIRLVPSVSRHFIESGNVPGFGDTVDCEGALFVGDGGYMQIKVRDRNLFRILDVVPRNVTMADLVPADRNAFEVGDKVIIDGQIQGKYHLEGFAWILDLGDAEGRSVSLFVPESVTALSGELDLGSLYLSQVRVTGGLEWYDSGQSWEVIPSSIRDIRVLSPYSGDSYVTLKAAEFLANASAYQNKFVQLDNVTVEWRYADYLFSVSDSTTYGEISVFVDYDANASSGIDEGDLMHVRGWVTFYDENKNGVPDEGEWEIKVRALSSDYALRVDEMGAAA